MSPRAEIGVFGGSGFQHLLDGAEQVRVETPYGDPSDLISIAEVGGRTVAFLPRHGHGHRLPPHQIPYRANVWAMRELGVRQLLAPCAAGSLDPGLPPGAMVLVDQFVDRTSSRAHTFYDGPGATHVAGADPYCSDLRALLLRVGLELGLDVRADGTMVVIEGPRFSTRAESRWFRAMGCQVVNMTGYPEVMLARELQLCYSTIALITDYDTGIADDPAVEPVTADQVLAGFAASLEQLRTLLLTAIEQIDVTRTDACSRSLEGASL